MNTKEQQCDEYRRNLERATGRLHDLETRGIAALSRYDIEIAHSGHAQLALETALRLKRNHISYDAKRLEKCGEPVQQITLFDLAE